ncbi:MAG: 2-dehydro-3-deoxy-6-phosphogalactonate aldolase [Notoacmeibacter sp.]|nr:2-dehydro-3-deoxy-6-phosphogalactonate aldolase [Notoacmeibacter sp.]MCC0031652.1 2-dehydro-3-deoxy-6-phosphogalactonate aldolase [Brucellaceae bacterium]
MMRKLVAILRGVKPDEVVDIGAALVGAGFGMIEVPLNSPQPFDSIARLAKAFGDQALVGAGTVLTPGEVAQVEGAGGRLIVSPNCDPAVIRATVGRGMVSMPGVFTPTECFAAIAAGARAIKLFPASLAGPAGVKAVKAVLPPDIELYAVGGASAENFADWFAAGAAGFGIGTALYRPGDSADTVSHAAKSIVAAHDGALA